jgi:hypothetical protein
MEHFQIIVNAMLGWSDEPKTPNKSVAARHPGIAGTRHGFDDEDEEELIEDEDDFEPDEELNIKAEADQPASAKAASGSWPVAEAMDEEI